MHLHCPVAVSTFHVAAPMELAAAAFDYLLDVRVEASSAAHELAPVDGFRCLVAAAPMCPQRTQLDG